MNQVVHPQDHQSASPWIAPQAPVWLRPVPFFMSALLFMSAIFTVFSPFPLILLSFRKSFRWFWVAAASNLIIVYLLGGQTSAAFFGVLGVGTAFGISHFMVRKGFKPDQAAASTLAVLFLLSLGVGGGIGR